MQVTDLITPVYKAMQDTSFSYLIRLALFVTSFVLASVFVFSLCSVCCILSWLVFIFVFFQVYAIYMPFLVALIVVLLVITFLIRCGILLLLCRFV